MPLYEYECADCGQVTEALQRLSDAPLTECPQCGGRLKKLLSAPAFQFKGSGWYVTDYARKGGESKGSGDTGGSEKKAAGGDASGSGDGAGSKPEGGSKKEAKSAAKSAEKSGSSSGSTSD